MSNIKILDDNGRISIPKDLRDKLQFENGDVLKLLAEDGDLLIRKVSILDHEGNSDTEIMNSIQNAFNSLSQKEKLKLTNKLIKMIERMG